MLKKILRIFIVVTLLLIVGSVVAGYLMKDSAKEFQGRAEQAQVKMVLAGAVTAIELFKVNHNVYPESLDQVEGVESGDVDLEYQAVGDTFYIIGRSKGTAIKMDHDMNTEVLSEGLSN